MIRRFFLTVAALFGLQSFTACGSTNGVEENRRPSRAAILRQAITCGLRTENLEFSVDEEGVDNAMIFPIGTRTAQYDRSVECMMGWAASSGAALGFEFEPRQS